MATDTATDQELLRRLLAQLKRGNRLLVTQQEAAELLSLSRKTVSQMTVRGEIPVVYAGRKPLYPVAALERWVEQQLEEAGGRNHGGNATW